MFTRIPLLDLGRTARENFGLMEFKRGWGAIEEPLTYYYFPRCAGLAGHVGAELEVPCAD